MVVMSDPIDIASLATHGGTGIAGATMVGAFMRWLAGKEANAAREEFILLRQDVKRLIEDVGEHKKVFADVVTTMNAVKALGEKFDELKHRVAQLETRRRK